MEKGKSTNEKKSQRTLRPVFAVSPFANPLKLAAGRRRAEGGERAGKRGVQGERRQDPQGSNQKDFLQGKREGGAKILPRKNAGTYLPQTNALVSFLS